MGKMSWLLKAARNPVESVVFIFSTGLFLFSCYMLTPLYAATYVISSGFPTRLGELGLGLLFLLASVPGMTSMFYKNQKKVLKLSTFNLFLSFLFLFVLRVLVQGWFPLTWIYPLMISLAHGALRLYLEVSKD